MGFFFQKLKFIEINWALFVLQKKPLCVILLLWLFTDKYGLDNLNYSSRELQKKMSNSNIAFLGSFILLLLIIAYGTFLHSVYISSHIDFRFTRFWIQQTA